MATDKQIIAIRAIARDNGIKLGTGQIERIKQMENGELDKVFTEIRSKEKVAEVSKKDVITQPRFGLACKLIFNTSTRGYWFAEPAEYMYAVKQLYHLMNDTEEVMKNSPGKFVSERLKIKIGGEEDD